ncbi:non-ribosomal peptide synthetase [Photobacterium sp. TY1-4]|uniref:non-ribosomal peptide synthetase n=1 Tax=Photobacterium sp. TY1-4 TaxID=2899122 RepID=UPI0021BF8355|nr:non-ribosomal peptide synthetase [Photobacterium sp. TY1-4]UXI04284.1 amino acid adenylation domain-containing protein [Photobacterium sp. TY1-4]
MAKGKERRSEVCDQGGREGSLHPAQESVYYEQQLYPQSPIYNVGSYQVITQAVDIDRMRRAWTILYRELDVLRMQLVANEPGAPRQSVLPPMAEASEMMFFDFSAQTDPEQAAQLWIEQQFDQLFSLEHGHAHQVSLLQLADDIFWLAFRFHHLFMDGLGVYRLYERWHQVYTSLGHQTDCPWLKGHPQFLPQAQQARDYISSRRYQSDQTYWQQFLADQTPTRLPRYYDQDGSDEYSMPLSESLCSQLENYCARHRVSILAVMTAVSSRYFAATLDQPQLMLATAVHGRSGKQAQQVIGMLSNVIPVGVTVSPDMPFAEFVVAISQQLGQSFRHSRFPVSHFARLTETPRGQLSDIHVLYEKFSELAPADYPYGAGPAYEIVPRSSRFDPQPLQIRLLDYETNAAFTLRLSYARAYFSRSEIQALAARWMSMLTFVLNDDAHQDSHLNKKLNENRVSLTLAELPVTIQSDLDDEWGQISETVFPQSQTLVAKFEHQARYFADHPAVHFQDTSLTYAELNQRANQLARAIQARYQARFGQPLPPDTLVGLYHRRGIDMVVSILAVLKAGGAYVPIDPQSPPERCRFILEDTQAPLIVTEQSLTEQLTQLASALAMPPETITADDRTALAAQCDINLPQSGLASDLAYVIYTSGTTGAPKGVLQTQQNVLRLFDASQTAFAFDADDVWVMYHAYSFDFSVWELWGALLHGGALVIPSADEVRDMALFSALCRRYRVSVLNQTPAAFYSLAAELLEKDQCWPELRYVIFGGDKLNLAQLSPWWARHGDQQPQLINMYGITETTVHVTFKRLHQGMANSGSYIGRPLADMRGYVLDRHLQPVPTGTAGELYVGGAGLARGYLNRPELTEERFVPHPCPSAMEQAQGWDRLYRSGDLVRRLPDGELEYLGRNDFQVKIRGYRIELGEIEAAILAHGSIKQAVVIDREHQGHKFLAAYLIAESGKTIPLDHLQAELADRLPEYMVPASYTELDSLPLTHHGKLDRARLPEPVLTETQGYVGPRSALEAVLCDAWQQALGLAQVGIQDNFFRIGGDSIIAIELVSRMRRAGVSAQVKDIFAAPTVAQLAHRLDNCRDQAIDAEQGLLTGELGLLPIQQQFFAMKLAVPEYWNQAFMVEIPPEITPHQLDAALSALVAQHDMLRCRFRIAPDGSVSQYYAPSNAIPVALETLDVGLMDEAELEAWLSQRQSGFDLEAGPLWRVVRLNDATRTRLWFAFHHLIIDVVSWRILADDLRFVLNGGQLGRKTSSYRQWQQAVGQYASRHVQEVEYWRTVMADHIVGSGYDTLTATQPFRERQTGQLMLSEAQTDLLLREANQGFDTEINDLLLTALVVALSQVFHEPVHHVTLESHGRELDVASLDVSKTVGWFTSLYPVRLEADDDLATTIRRTKQILQAVPNKGIGFGALAGLLGDISLPKVCFNYFGQLNPAVEEGGTSLWSILTEQCGRTRAAENQVATGLELNGAVRHGRLMFQIDSQLTSVQHQAFVRQFEDALLAVIDRACFELRHGDHPPQAPVAYHPPGNRFWYFQRTRELERWGPCVMFKFQDLQNHAFTVQQAMDAVVGLHEGLRINLVQHFDQAQQSDLVQKSGLAPQSGDWLEQICPVDVFDCVSVVDCSAMSDADVEQQLAQFRQSIAFDQALFRCFYCDFGASQPDRLYMAIHHLVMDRYSLGIFFRDFLTALTQSQQGQLPQLTRTGASFREWQQECQSWLQSDEARINARFWTQQLQQPVSPLPTDQPFDHLRNSIGSRREISLRMGAELSQSLKGVASDTGVHAYDLVMAALVQTLSAWCGGGAMCFEEVLVGREQSALDLSGTVGWLNDYVPVIVSPANDKRGLALVQAVRDEIQACKQHSRGFSDLKFRTAPVAASEDFSALPAPEIDINFIPESMSLGEEHFSHPLLRLTRYEAMVGESREAIHKLSCTVSYEQGDMTMTWEYGDRIYQRQTVEMLAERCRAALLVLVHDIRAVDPAAAIMNATVE